jgi:hypothetical protein
MVTDGPFLTLPKVFSKKKRLRVQIDHRLAISKVGEKKGTGEKKGEKGDAAASPLIFAYDFS